MKAIYTHISRIVLVFSAMFFMHANANAQEHENTKHYRVTAFKSGNPGIQSQSNIAKVVPIATLYIPTAFTPNSDGMNEKFGIVGQGIGSFNMKIYNAWGEMIFETNKPEDGWDGTFKGAASPVGTYLYIVTARSIKGENIYRNGNFVLLK